MKTFSNFTLITTAIITLTLTGCATTPTPAYVPADKYQAYDCNLLTSEYTRLDQYIATAPRSSGIRSTGVGIGIGAGRGGIYPTISMGMGTGSGGNTANIATAMGERDAVVQSARLKQCGFATGLKLYSEK